MWNNYPKSKSKKKLIALFRCLYINSLFLSIFTLSFVSLFRKSKFFYVHAIRDERYGHQKSYTQTKKKKQRKHAQLTKTQ